MNNVISLLRETIQTQELVSATFSAPKQKTNEDKSIHVKATNAQSYKVEFRKVKHNDIKTMAAAEFEKICTETLLANYKQILIQTKNSDYQVLINKKLKAKIIKKNSGKKNITQKTKNYLIPDGEPCDFLIKIGVMSPNGKVKANYYKKFKQINRFLEHINDLFKDDKKESIHIVDFGCGKSYLTFATYYYFSEVLKKKVEITGVDLKEDVIRSSNLIAEELGYDHLKFVHGMIHNFESQSAVDFVITLHACDTATDEAILFSLKHQCEKMMFVPCCQHELNKQLENNHSAPLLKHGIFKDRMTAIVTDSMRAQLLTLCGYKTQIIEFIDMEHTAKNVLLRCEKTSFPKKIQEQNKTSYENFKREWNISPYLEKEIYSSGFLD